MNENIDLAFTGAKLAAIGNELVSIAIHGASAAYNIGQMARYRLMYLNGQTVWQNGGNPAAVALTEQYRREMVKHTILTGIDVISLFLIGITSKQRTCY